MYIHVITLLTFPLQIAYMVLIPFYTASCKRSNYEVDTQSIHLMGEVFTLSGLFQYSWCVCTSFPIPCRTWRAMRWRRGRATPISLYSVCIYNNVCTQRAEQFTYYIVIHDIMNV